MYTGEERFYSGNRHFILWKNFAFMTPPTLGSAPLLLKDATAFLFRLSYLRTQREKETRNACKTAGSKVYYMYNIFIRSISCVYMYNIYIYIYIIDRYTNYTLTKIKSFVLLITHRYVRTFFISLTCKMRDKDDDNNKTWIGHMHVAVLSHNFAGTNGFLFFFFP